MMPYQEALQKWAARKLQEQYQVEPEKLDLSTLDATFETEGGTGSRDDSLYEAAHTLCTITGRALEPFEWQESTWPFGRVVTHQVGTKWPFEIPLPYQETTLSLVLAELFQEGEE